MERFNEPTLSKDDVLHLCWRQNNYIYRCVLQVYYKNSNRKNPKPLYWIVIEIMSVMIKEGPAAVL